MLQGLNGIDEVQLLTYHQPNTDNCSIAWAQAEDGSPLLCYAGSTALIKIVNALTGELVQVSDFKELRGLLIFTFHRCSQVTEG
jgi:hypothetical protein